MHPKIATELNMLGMFDYEKIEQPLYDTEDYPAEGGYINLFVLPLGYDGKGFERTNMYLGSLVPFGQAFILESVSVKLLQDRPSMSDERKFYANGSTRRHGGVGPGLECHRWARHSDPTNLESAAKLTQNGRPAPYNLSPNNLLLTPNQNFRLQLRDLPKLKRPARVHAKLFGTLVRSTQ